VARKRKRENGKEVRERKPQTKEEKKKKVNKEPKWFRPVRGASARRLNSLGRHCNGADDDSVRNINEFVDMADPCDTRGI